MQGAKGDGSLPEYLVECKSTQTKALKLELEWLCKLLHEARMVGKYPALTVTFTDKLGRPHSAGNWVLIEEDQFNRLTKA